MFSVGHTLVEFSVVMLLALGLLSVAKELTVKLVIGVVGGAVLIAFGAAQIYSSLKPKAEQPQQGKAASGSLILMGLALTGLHPFFILLWLTAGPQLIIMSVEFASFAGVVFMYACHVWMDYTWLMGTAHFAKRGMSVVDIIWYRLVMTVFGVILIYFGLAFILGFLTL
jgi:threonine/homoserine/homoserine lactone efflux protein